MNFDDLQKQWNQQFDGTESANDLAIKLFQNSRQGKIQSILRKLTFHSLLFMIFNLVILVFSWIVLVEEIGNWLLFLPAAVMIVLSKIVFYMNVAQLGLIQRIDYSKPIVSLQKTVERLKVKRIRHNRFIFVFCILYFWLAVTLFFRWDLAFLIPAIWTKAPIVVVVHVGMLLIWFPLSLWLLRIYDNVDETNRFTSWLERGSYLTDYSLNFSLNESLGFLKELKAFDSKDA